MKKEDKPKDLVGELLSKKDWNNGYLIAYSPENSKSTCDDMALRIEGVSLVDNRLKYLIKGFKYPFYIGLSSFDLEQTNKNKMTFKAKTPVIYDRIEIINRHGYRLENLKTL